MCTIGKGKERKNFRNLLVLEHISFRIFYSRADLQYTFSLSTRTGHRRHTHLMVEIYECNAKHYRTAQCLD